MPNYTIIFTDDSVLKTEAESVEISDGCLIFRDVDNTPVAFANQDLVKTSYIEGLTTSYEEAEYEDDDEDEDED